MADLDECSGGVDKCGDGEKCVNAEGGYSCDCKKGYMKKDGACVKGKLLKKDVSCDHFVASLKKLVSPRPRDSSETFLLGQLVGRHA